MNIIDLFNDYNIPYSTQGKNNTPGWVNVTCPYCGDHSTHLGYNIGENYFHCWRCGGHPIVETISKLTHLSEKEAKQLIKQYNLASTPVITKEPIVRIHQKHLKLPSNATPLTYQHKEYLAGRGFDPDYLEQTWNLLGTGPISTLCGTDYKHRILIPFIWEDRFVSFTTRDITGKARQRYKSCPREMEVVHHKDIVYGLQSKWKDIGICVEGPADAWRFGRYGFATAGIEFTHKQVRVIAKHFKRVAVCFDNEPQAIAQANKLVAELRFRGVDAFRVNVENDPGSMPQDEANAFVKEIKRKVL